MDKDFDETVDETGDTDLVLKDPRFDYGIQKHIEESIAEGVKPHIAAGEKGITKERYDAWYTNIPTFKEWIDFLVGKHLSNRRRKVLEKIDEVEDPAKAAQLNMQYLERADTDFGTKRQHITTEEKQTMDPEVDKKEADDFINRHRLDGADGNEPDNPEGD